tara:strand:+ start:1999 stop:3081 length:1083 start_codon:yes stop_codon:yes gene_type:complete
MSELGEFFTCEECVEEILKRLPSEVWKSGTKWFEPTCGDGKFIDSILNKSEGLEIHMTDINKKNTDICKEKFKNNTNINIYCEDVLSQQLRGFDVIIGNPPFNTVKDSKLGKNKIYERITIDCIKKLNPEGILAFIVPQNMFGGNSSKAYQYILENTHVIEIYFFSLKDRRKFFPTIQQPICYFILKKTGTNNSKKTNILPSDINIMLQNRPLNPVNEWTIHTENLVNKYITIETNKSVYNRGYPINKYTGTKYPLVLSQTKRLYTDDKEMARGYKIPKIIIFGISTCLSWMADLEGDYGVGPNTFYIPVVSENELKTLEIFFKSNECKKIIESTKTTRQFMKISSIRNLNLQAILQHVV